MRKRPAPRPAGPRARRSRVRARLTTLAVTAAPAILAFQGTALAKGSQTDAPQIIFSSPLLDATGVAVVGSAIATIGAYRLMKARKRSRKPEDDPKER
jgi:hypothetical protein